jgi:hypothetical protein
MHAKILHCEKKDLRAFHRKALSTKAMPLSAFYWKLEKLSPLCRERNQGGFGNSPYETTAIYQASR